MSAPRGNSESSPLPDGSAVLRRSNAKKLAAGYTRTKRALECCYLSVATFLWASQLRIVAQYFLRSALSPAPASDPGLSSSFPSSFSFPSFFSFLSSLSFPFSLWLWVLAMALLAMLLADFISGVAHWGFDTWGTPDTAVFGNFIRSFREHHVNQTAMTKHDFIETNADTTLPLIPVLLLQRYCLGLPREDGAGGYNIHSGNAGSHVFLLTLFLFITFTNEFHKWVHEAKPHFLARALIRSKIILNPQVHRLHHKGNYDSNYCITTGWMNMPLEKISFWRRAESLITALTGAIPRANDQSLLGK